MKVAIIGSRNLQVKMEEYLPKNISLIISGGARGIDTLAEEYADRNGIPKLIFLPDYKRYGKRAPLIRNKLIVDNADIIIAFWDGQSRGTKFTTDYAKKAKQKSDSIFNKKFMFCCTCRNLPNKKPAIKTASFCRFTLDSISIWHKCLKHFEHIFSVFLCE